MSVGYKFNGPNSEERDIEREEERWYVRIVLRWLYFALHHDVLVQNRCKYSLKFSLKKRTHILISISLNFIALRLIATVSNFLYSAREKESSQKALKLNIKLRFPSFSIQALPAPSSVSSPTFYRLRYTNQSSFSQLNIFQAFGDTFTHTHIDKLLLRE